MLLRVPDPVDVPAMLAINNDFAAETSPLTMPALHDLIGQGFWTRVAGAADAFCIALDQDATYASPNFQWFRARFPRFVYVDRVVVARGAHGRGLGRMLYRALTEAARESGHDRICAEINAVPPNPASDRFHAAFGFTEIGRAELADSGKTVRYVSLSL